MNVMWYVGKFDEATWQFFNALGLSPSHLRSASRGMAAVDQHISYIEELRAGDVVTIRTTLIEFKEKSLRFTHEMFNRSPRQSWGRGDENGPKKIEIKINARVIEVGHYASQGMPRMEFGLTRIYRALNFLRRCGFLDAPRIAQRRGGTTSEGRFFFNNTPTTENP